VTLICGQARDCRVGDVCLLTYCEILGQDCTYRGDVNSSPFRFHLFAAGPVCWQLLVIVICFFRFFISKTLSGLTELSMVTITAHFVSWEGYWFAPTQWLQKSVRFDAHSRFFSLPCTFLISSWGGLEILKVFFGKREGKRPIGSSGRRRADNIKIAVNKMWLEVVRWIRVS
jgi:hypothetical protein